MLASFLQVPRLKDLPYKRQDLRGSDPGEYVVVNMSLVLMQARSVGIWTWACQEASDGSALSP